MARKPVTDMSAWPSLSLEGNLIAPAMVAKIDQRTAPEQTEESYRIRKGLTVRDEISAAFRVGQSHFDAFAKVEDASLEVTRRFVEGFLKEAFGFEDLAHAHGALSFLADSDRVPVVVVPAIEELDKRSATLSVDRPRSPAFALQDYLNDSDEALWGLVTNGRYLRLMRDNASLTRPAYIEADLSQMFANEDIASFATLWLMIHRTRFGASGTPATDCVLERWRETGAREGEVSRDRLAGQVEQALKDLGSGFLKANPDMALKLRQGDIPLTEWFNELLRLIYRLIFLMVAEDRNLLHPTQSRKEARSLYADGYSLKALRAHCVRRASWDRHYDRFEAVKIVFRALTHGQDALALPALGGLFDEENLALLGTARLQNNAFMKAIWHLSWLSDRNSMVPVNWREMETEELGSVYETLLELQPQLGDDGVSLVFASDTAEKKGNQRKTTGSYYTPDSLVQALLDTALDPVLNNTEAEADDPAKALLKLSVIDPACGSGHFLLAAARRIATRLARIRAQGTPSLADFRHALRDVARSCIHGVDRNPMAVELTKVALWIETVDPGLPLGFFDAQIRCGDSLLGVFDLQVLEEGIPDAAYKPLTGDDKTTASYYKKANHDAKKGQGSLDFTGGGSGVPIGPISADFSGLRDLSEETIADIETKAKTFRSLRKQDSFQRALMGCDLYVAPFFLPKVGDIPMSPSEQLIPTSEDVWIAVGQGRERRHDLQNTLVASDVQAFHWPLEFPDIMARGGFDVIIGNPPWERIKLQEKEFFASRDADIATAPNKAARDRLIKGLVKAEPGSPKRRLFEAFEAEKRRSEATSTFVRVSEQEGGRFPYTGVGDVNTYALFAELFAHLVGPKGRAGVIVPTGIATDATTAPFFAHLVDEKRLASLVDFENSAPLFPGVHRSFKFCLLTMGRNEAEAHFAFFLTEPAQLAEPERNFTLSPEQIAAINPNTKTAPVFRSQADAEITAKIYRNAPVLIDEGKGFEGNPWGVSFMAMFHMSNDSGLFRTAPTLEAEGFVRDGVDWVSLPDGQEERGEASTEVVRYVPLYEAKMIHQFDHRWAGYDADGTNSADATQAEKMDPAWEPQPRYWVPDGEVTARLEAKGWKRDWLMGWRDITNATNERTVIATVFPQVGVGNNLPLMLLSNNLDATALTGLSASLSSLALDFVARHKVGGTHINFFIYEQLPILSPNFYTESRLAFIIPRVLELTYTSQSLASFARDLGHDGSPFAWDEERRALLRADLDAFYARAYGLTRDELRYILNPSDVKGEDYPSETFRVLKNKELRQYGEYRTRRLVLEAWDRMEANGEFTEMEM